MKKILNKRQGFTIIEVVLVLAIAGLIFMMVFIALPALQRSQRDTQRSNDISRVVTALNNYQANNRGAIPTTGSYVKGHDSGSTSATSAANSKTWRYFYDTYLITNAGGAQDVFADPDGSYYSLWIRDCNAAAGGTGECNASVQRYNVSFDLQSSGLTGENSASAADTASGDMGHSIGIILKATCQGEVAYKSTGSRKVAIVYKKEGGGTFCLNN